MHNHTHNLNTVTSTMTTGNWNEPFIAICNIEHHDTIPKVPIPEQQSNSTPPLLQINLRFKGQKPLRLIYKRTFITSITGYIWQKIPFPSRHTNPPVCHMFSTLQSCQFVPIAHLRMLWFCTAIIPFSISDGIPAQNTIIYHQHLLVLTRLRKLLELTAIFIQHMLIMKLMMELDIDGWWWPLGMLGGWMWGRAGWFFFLWVVSHFGVQTMIEWIQRREGRWMLVGLNS